MYQEDSDEQFRSAKLGEMYRRAAEEFAAGVIADPRNALREQAGAQAGFEARLEALWGRGLDLADLVVWYGLESGGWVNELLRPAAVTRQGQKFEALIRLHGKAAMTAREVFVLLRSGFSTGALARWRTLHEVWVVFILLADGDEELSRRYLAHEVVESLRGQKEYEQTWQALGLEPPDWTTAERQKAWQDLAAEFDRTFLEPYGWAAPLFNNKAKNSGTWRITPSWTSGVATTGWHHMGPTQTRRGSYGTSKASKPSKSFGQDHQTWAS